MLASDAFEGRAPGHEGRGAHRGLPRRPAAEDRPRSPGTPTGRGCRRSRSWARPCREAPPSTFRKGATERRLAWRDDYVAWTKRVVARASLDASELVFVGYGVQAPEFQWDDYKGVDLRGKTMVVLVGDPPVPDPREARRARPEDVRRQGDDLLRPLDLQVRDGREARGRGRPHRPRDGARRVSLRDRAGQDHGAVRPARRPTATRVAPRSRDGSRSTRPKGLFRMAGQDFEALEAKAATREFQPVPLGVTASVSLDERDPQGPLRQRRGPARGQRPEA